MKLRILLSVACGILFVNCSDTNSHIPSVDHIILDNEIVRFDKAFAKSKNYDELIKLKNTYPAFSDLYFNEVMDFVKEENDSLWIENIVSFKTDSVIQFIMEKIDDEYADFNKINADIEDALKRIEYHFPNKSAPNVYTFHSGLQYQKFIFSDNDRDGIALGLDFFLGADFPYQKVNPANPNFSRYITRTFNKDHLVKSAIDIWVDDLLGEVNGNKLLDHIIYQGKKLYILEKLIPSTSDTILHEYSEAQLTWCHLNQKQTWSYLLSEQLFYTSDRRTIAKLTEPAPTSSGMPPDSPGRVVNYIGWQIVKSYMRRYPEVNLSALIELTDAQMILDKSRFRP